MRMCFVAPLSALAHVRRSVFQGEGPGPAPRIAWRRFIWSQRRHYLARWAVPSSSPRRRICVMPAWWRAS